MKKNAILFFILLQFTGLVSFSQKRTDFKDRLLTGTITGYIHNPAYPGTNPVNIHDNYNISVNEIITQKIPGAVLVNKNITLGNNISEAVVTFGNPLADSFSYTITNIPYNKNFILILYDKRGNINESVIKKDEGNYIVTGAFFQNTRTPMWAKDFEYSNMNIKKCIPTNSTIVNDISVKLITPISIH